MKILLTGATGFIGDHVLRTLSAHDFQIKALTRRPKNQNPILNGVEWIQFDFQKALEPEDWNVLLKDIDLVVNTVGIIQESGKQKFSILHEQAPIALFMACKNNNVARVIQISALGADANAVTAYQTSKLAADNFLRNSSLDWTIFQPSIVYGSGDHSMNFFKAMAAQPLVVVISDGNQLIQPVRVEDLVQAILQSAIHQQGSRQSITVTGADKIRFIDLLRQLRLWFNLGPARILHIPLTLAKLAARIGNLIPGSMLTTETLFMLKQGNVAKTNQFEETFGFVPMGIIENLKRHRATNQDKVSAGLFFLKHLLRYSISLVWIGSGLVSALFSINQGYALLAKLGLHGIWADLSLYGASAMDIVLGIAVFTNYRSRLSSFIQVLLIVVYTMIISYFIPQYWLDPFGAVLKNLVLVTAILVWGILDNDS